MFNITKAGSRWLVSGASIYLGKSREMVPLRQVCETRHEAERIATKFTQAIMDQAEDENDRRDAIADYLARRRKRTKRVPAQLEMFAL
jgi:hypothetical protein